MWPENPRLNPEETHFTLKDFAEDLTNEPADKKDFYELITSISEDGFIPADPEVVWKNEENNKYYVAEGNRRLVALKLLREPHKTPKSIRSFVRKASEKMNLIEIEKIPVNVAPTFEDAEWYINQRNSSSSLQRKWTRVQQQRWIVTLYEKHNGDIEKIISITKLSKSELEGFFRILKIKDFVKLDEVKSKLTESEFDLANSYRFPITILERFFNFSIVKEKWGIEYNGIDVNITSVKSSFYNGFAELIKRILGEDDKINTRLTLENLNEVLDSLPKVLLVEENIIEDIADNENENKEDLKNETIGNDKSEETKDKESTASDETSNVNPKGESDVPPKPSTQSITILHLKGNPNRHKIIIPIYTLNTSNYRLLGLFNELKKISLLYNNIVSASLRVFLDLSVLNYIETEGIANAIKSYYKDDLKNIALKKRIEYLKQNHLNGKAQVVATRLIDHSNQYSLDVLNGYIHGKDTHYLN
ncbi:MAG: ParB N-terminal domain-containing protein [Bacteroidetes bacterium]|nr:ParB N-terminal domain-containing protein [Bacteroidota bacterium]